MKITHEKANNMFEKAILNIQPVFYKKWQGHKFEISKLISTTEKGDMGEDFLSSVLKECGYQNVEVVKGRRGHFDVEVKQIPNIVQFEVKVATEDTNSHFQFNGIRYDTKYTHLFCFGISPNDIGYIIINKNDLNNHSMVSMAKGSNSSFKLTKNKKDLKNFDIFCDDMKIITGILNNKQNK
jgi:hypothetical protein